MSDRLFFEFFAGGGMARAGLGEGWRCGFANDFDPMKGAAYASNWGADHLIVGDVATVAADQLHGEADLVWASFPCQDVSLAGEARGMGKRGDAERTRSGSFWPFWDLMSALRTDGRAPKFILLENVYGVLTSNEGRDFAAVGKAFAAAGYRFGAVMVDAARFVPQSRPRIFIIGVRGDVAVPGSMKRGEPDPAWHPRAMIDAVGGLSVAARKRWIWWRLTPPAPRTTSFADLIEAIPSGVQWHTRDETDVLIAKMSARNREKVELARKSGRRMVGGVYKRTRIENGVKVQRAEIRFDDVAGCLRTPAGGSSRQVVMIVEGRSVRSRLLSPREAARLMGLPESYKLPPRYNDAYHLAGDGVAVPVVRFLAAEIVEPILSGADSRLAAVA